MLLFREGNSAFKLYVWKSVSHMLWDSFQSVPEADAELRLGTRSSEGFMEI